jgi:SAM-dependent methyltransferase
VVEEYVEAARSIGVRAERYDGERVPLEDGAVDTVILIEVLEHLDDPRALLREAARVAARNVLVTTPNCTQSFGSVPIEFSHMLDLDHRQFFTADALRELLEASFERCEVVESHPLDAMIANLVLPRGLGRLYRAFARAGAARPRYFSRLLGEGWIGGEARR